MNVVGLILGTRRLYYDTNPVSVFSVSVLLAGLSIAWFLGQSRFNHTLIRQVSAALASWFAVFFAFYTIQWMGRYPESDGLGAVAVALAFSIGYALSAFKGPSWTVAGLAHVALVVALVFSGLFLVGSLVTILDKNKRRSAPTSEREIMFIAAIIGVAIGLYCLWLLIKTPRYTALHHRMSKGQCPNCTYDLRGSVGQADCPECGRAIPWERVVLPAD